MECKSVIKKGKRGNPDRRTPSEHHVLENGVRLVF